MKTRRMKRNEGVASTFDKGRQLAYWEILDIIKTRKDMISDVLSEEEADMVQQEHNTI